MPTNSSVPITPGSGAEVAAFSFSEDGKTKQLQRFVASTPDGLATAFGPGPVTATTPRVSLAADDPAVVALGFIKTAGETLAPGAGFVEITGAADLNPPARALAITADGLLSVKLVNGTDNAGARIPVKAGQLWPLQAVRLNGNNTAGVIAIR